MKVLITGARGFIGSHLKELIDGAVTYDLKDGQDIRDKKKLKKYMKDVDVVVHLAAQTSIKHAWDDPADYYSHNVVGTANVIETAIECGVKHIVYASSASVYSPLENPYSLSKTICEDLFRLRQDKIKCIAFRFMNVYGKGQNPSYGTVIPSFYKGIKKGKISIYGDGKQTRDYVRVEDVCWILNLATLPEYSDQFEGFSVMDLGTGKGVSVNHLAKIMMKKMNKKAEIEHIPARREVRYSVGDIKMLVEKFDYEPVLDLNAGLGLVMKEGV
jgi:UDP-glucose 4-epimerase